MSATRFIEYGLGGYDTSKPNNNLICDYEIEDTLDVGNTEEDAANNALKASARAKLVAGTPLTEEEAATLVP